MALIDEFKELLQEVSKYSVYVEYDTTPLESRQGYFLTVGIDTEECSYNIQNVGNGFIKDRICFVVRLLSPKDTNSATLDTYFDTKILNPIAKSDTFNLISYKKERPNYTKYLDKVELVSTFIVDCITYLD